MNHTSRTTLVTRHAPLFAVALGILLALPRASEAGPPLICHPFQTGSEAVLPWGDGPSWNNPDRRYDVQRLTGDVIRLLSGNAPIIARMENLRRATIYASQEPRIANELMSALLARALSTTANGTADANALFDAGYLIETYKQAESLNRYNMLAPSSGTRWTMRSEPWSDGYALVMRAQRLMGANPDIEFAASLMKEGAASAEHRRKAAAGAASGSLLARNLAR